MSICGPTSAANVLRSIGVETGRNPFRRFGVRAMSLDEVVKETAEGLPAGWRGSALRLRDVDALRVQLRLSNDPGYRFISNFSRAPLFGRGGGHHSPVVCPREAGRSGQGCAPSWLVTPRWTRRRVSRLDDRAVAARASVDARPA